jgi:hypothetical protein
MAADSQRNTPHQPVMDDWREMGAHANGPSIPPKRGQPPRARYGFRISRNEMTKAPAPQGNQRRRGQPQGQFAIRQHRAEPTMPSSALYPPGRSRPRPREMLGSILISGGSARNQLRTARLKLKSFQKAPLVHPVLRTNRRLGRWPLLPARRRVVPAVAVAAPHDSADSALWACGRGAWTSPKTPSGRLPMLPRAPRRMPSSSAGTSSLWPAGTCCGRRRSGPR